MTHPMVDAVLLHNSALDVTASDVTAPDHNTLNSPPPRPAGMALDLLGSAALSDADLTAVVSSALGRPVEVAEYSVTTTPSIATAISTEAVLKVHGIATAGPDRLPWTVLVKILRSARHWPGITEVPEHVRQNFIDNLPWHVEADILTSNLPGLLPPGLRTPRLFRVDDLGDDRIAMWMEFIDVIQTPWDVARFQTAARSLGRLAGRRTAEAAAWTAGGTGRMGLRQLADGLLGLKIFPLLAGHSLCRNALLAKHADRSLRADLLTLADRVPAMLDLLDALTQSIGHGDACPQNLLVPADGPDTLVAIDISWQNPEAIGFDLGQLLMGFAHTGELAVDELPRLHDIVLQAYVQGLREEGCEVDIDDVRYGFDATMVLRSGFTSMPWDELNDPVTTELDSRVASRAALTRYLVDVGLALRQKAP